MSSVAIPASATTPALGTEADLIRQAARGDEESFGELYRRHGQTAWRLAQSVAIDRDGAVAAVAEGFGRALRGLRRQNRLEAEGFRPLLLAAVYRSAIEHVHANPGTAMAPHFSAPSRGRGSRAKAAEAALVEAAFRSLPERWRGAVWLGDVEAMEPERIAPILGVSLAVANQLLVRGRRGLAGRFAQASRQAPEHLGTALRPLAASVPANLSEEVTDRWHAMVSDPTARFAPLTGWLSERAVRPLWVSVGGLMGLGLIGLGIVGQSGAVNGGPVASNLPAGANAPGINPPGSGVSALSGGLGSGIFGVAAGSGLNPFNLSAPAGSSGAFGSGSAGSATGLTAPGSGATVPGTGSGSGGTDTGGNGGGGTGTGSSPVKTVVPLAPVASVTQSGSTTSANVLPTSTGGSTATVSTCSTGVGLTVGTVQIGCAPAGSTSSPSSTPAATNPVTSTVQGVTSTVSGVTQTVTNTVSSLTGL